MGDIKNKVIEEVKKIYDPEIPVNIYELGLIYKIEVDEKNKVNVDMTLTSPNCPVNLRLPLPDIFDDSINNISPPYAVHANPTATPEFLHRSAISE